MNIFIAQSSEARPEPNQGQRIIVPKEEAVVQTTPRNNNLDMESVFYVAGSVFLLVIAGIALVQIFAKPRKKPNLILGQSQPTGENNISANKPKV